jgi:hypothetical protein
MTRGLFDRREDIPRTRSPAIFIASSKNTITLILRTVLGLQTPTSVAAKVPKTGPEAAAAGAAEKIISPTHKETEGRVPVWGSE